MRMSRTVVCSGKNKKAVKSTMATCSCYVLQILQETLAAVVGRSVVCGLRVNWRHACFSTTLSAMGACKSAESENNVRQMTDLLLNPPTLQAKSSEWSWSEYFLPACPPHPLPPRLNFLNVVINKKNSHILRNLPLILCLSDLNVTLPVFLATFHAKWESQGLLQFTAWQKPTHRKNWWERNMPHILIITHFGRETVIITERTVKCCSCGSEKGWTPFSLPLVDRNLN